MARRFMYNTDHTKIAAVGAESAEDELAEAGVDSCRLGWALAEAGPAEAEFAEAGLADVGVDSCIPGRA